MIADIILLIIAFIAVLFATIADIKTTEIPNWITYNLIISALAIRLINSLATNQFYYIINAIIILAIVFIIAQLSYRLQIWGGGDSKLLIALSVTFATKPYFLNFSYPFLLILITNILLAGAVYSIIFAAALAIKHRKKFIPEIKNLHQKTKIIRLATLLLSVILFMLALLTSFIMKILFTATAAMILIYPYIWIAIKATENSALYKKISPKKLIEGDWITQNIIKNNQIIYKKQKTGITKKQIENLIKNKIKRVTIKAGIPFAPSFILGLILTVIIGLI